MEVGVQGGVLWIQEFDVTSVVGDLDAAFLVSPVSLVVVQWSRFRRWCTRQIAFFWAGLVEEQAVDGVRQQNIDEQVGVVMVKVRKNNKTPCV